MPRQRQSSPGMPAAPVQISTHSVAVLGADYGDDSKGPASSQAAKQRPQTPRSAYAVCCLGSVSTTQACQQYRDSGHLVLSAKQLVPETGWDWGPAELAEGVTWHMATRSSGTAPKARPAPSRVRSGRPERAQLSHQGSFEEGWRRHWAAMTLARTLHNLASPASNI